MEILRQSAREYFCLLFLVWAARCAPKNTWGKLVLVTIHNLAEDLRYELEREQAIRARGNRG